MSNPPTSKRHHYRPQVHLRHFADKTERIYCYDALTSKCFVTDIINVGIEGRLYAITNDPSVAEDAFEKWLATYVDGPVGDAFKNVVNRSQTFVDVDRIAIARFAVAQIFRTPDMKATFLDEARRAMRDNMYMLKADAKQAMGATSSEEEIAAVDNLTVSVNDEAWLDVIAKGVAKHTETVFNMVWSVVEAPPHFEWISNDHGLVRLGNIELEPLPLAKNVKHGSPSVFLPVSDRFGIAMMRDDRSISQRNFSQWARKVNRMLVYDAQRFVYSKSFQPFVLKNCRLRDAESRSQYANEVDSNS